MKSVDLITPNEKCSRPGKVHPDIVRFHCGDWARKVVVLYRLELEGLGLQLDRAGLEVSGQRTKN